MLLQAKPLVRNKELTKLKSKVTNAPNARTELEASFSNPAKTATYAMSATNKSKISRNVRDAVKIFKASFKYFTVSSRIDLYISILIL